MEKRQSFKRRKFVKGAGKNMIDHYPEIDKYIPEAEAVANEKFDEKKHTREQKDLFFLAAMDDILSKKGLRVL